MTVKALCAYLKVSRSGYYKWKKSPESKLERENEKISILWKSLWMSSLLVINKLVIAV